MRKLAAFLVVVMLMGLAPAAHAEEAVPAAHAEAAAPALSNVVARVSPSVVGISVVKREPSDIPGEEPRLIAAAGSGFVVRPGYVLSNAHVLDHALAAAVVAYDGKIYPIDPAKIWADPVSDLAVAKVDADLPPITWADMNALRPGDSVFAIGSPFGLEFRGSVSRGIISGFQRPLGADYPFLQTDAPINPGNSGGPLFNLAGEVVGVNARGIRGADGMGFSIPADLARSIADALIHDGAVARAWLGLRFMEGAETPLAWSEADGPMVTMVEADGPAAKTGIQVGDLLVGLNDKRVKSIDDVATFLRTVAAGATVKLTYDRDGQEIPVQITVGTRPHDADLSFRADGLWVELTEAQRLKARQFGREWAELSEDELSDPWTVRAGSARAVMTTEFLAIARQSRADSLKSAPMTPAEADAVGARYRGLVTIAVDLPTRWQVTDPAGLWAEWQDDAGSIRAFDVHLTGNAPAGFQRISISFRSSMMEKQGVATLVLHLDQGTDRRFVFDLDSIH